MKNILQNFYLFSKLSMSIFLLLIIIFLGYLFYRSYSTIYFEESTKVTKNNDLLNSINSNSLRIEKIELILNENNSKLIDIMNTLKSSNENNQSNLVLKEIQNDFNNIKLELEKLQNNFQKKEIAENQPAQNNDYNINKEYAVQLIKFKFESGLDYSQELELLSKILGSKKIYMIENLYLLNSDRFVGNKILKSNFKSETNIFISNNLLKANKITKIVLPFIKIEPSQNQKLSDKRLIAIDNIYNQIENKNYSKSIDLINSINKDKKFFKLTLSQLYIAADFNKIIGDILERG